MVSLLTMNKLLVNIFVFLLAISFNLQGQILLHPNRGQWQQPIDYLVEMDAGYLFIENQGLTYNLFDYHSHHDASELHNEEEVTIQQHVVKTHFRGSQKPTKVSENQVNSYYRNYFLGQHSTTWKHSIQSISEVEYENVYPGINLNYITNEDGLKYSFIVDPHMDPSHIEIEISGSEHIEISEDGKLRFKTRFGWIEESRPIAWTENESGEKTLVDCVFKITSFGVKFQLSEYNSSQKLIIDPQLTFSTFTGATSDNWGYTACPDEQGNLYAGGIVFGIGYPTTLGSFDTSFSGGNATGTIPGFDISITKFNTNGTQNLFSTFLGGTGNETPNSIVTNDTGDLFILSTTSSVDFPVSLTAFQDTFSGGPATIQTLRFNGSDLAIVRLSSDGTTLQGSTYLGGTGNDGLNYGSNLKYNYGDVFRGEIIVDENSNVYFSSSTHSADFPVASSSGSLNGIQDAVYGKLNADLSALQFCNYFGNDGFETGNSIQLSPLNELYVTGGTTSDSLAFENGGFQDTLTGITDAYLIRADATTGTILNGTYLGTALYDQAYFVQVDLDNNVYVLGQTAGVYPITALFGIPNAKQFIHKLSQDLTISLWSTTIGSGIGNNEISPTAFLVSDCFDIYISGWGGVINSSNSLATQSSSNGFPLTSDAYQTVTNGSNFYIAVLARDADSLKYGTYMGGVSSSFNHVDGGTSRFDKDGTIYHAVCGSCGISTTGFTVTPGVWSTTAPSNNCNLAAFKFNLNTMTSTIGNTDQFICFPNPVIFQNNSSFGNSYQWNFGDDSTSTDENPTHAYATPGTYSVQLIVIDTNSCYYSDTSYFEIVIDEFEGGITQIVDPVCPNIPFQLEASGGYEYHWSPAGLVDDSLSATPIATISTPTTFQVIVIDSCGTDTLSIDVDVYTFTSGISSDTAMCIGDSIPISVDSLQLASINWQPSSFFQNPTAFSTTAFIQSSQIITAEIITLDGCPDTLSNFIAVDTIIPTVSVLDTTICEGTEIELLSSVDVDGGSYSWIGYSTIGSTLGSLSPTANTTYSVVYQLNTCVVSDSAVVTVMPQPLNLIINDTTICYGNSVNLFAVPDVLGGVFTWYDTSSILTNLTVTPSIGIHYYPVNYNLNGCFLNDSMRVEVLPQPTTLNLADESTCENSDLTLSANPDYAGGTFYWNHSGETSSQIMVNQPNGSTFYYVSYDLGGCVLLDSLEVTAHPFPMLTHQNYSICLGESLQIEVYPSIANGNFFWNEANQTSSSITVAPTSTTYYPVSYTTTNCTTFDTVVVTVNPLPTGLLVTDSVCQNELLHAEVMLDNLANQTFAWSINGTNIPNASLAILDSVLVQEGIYNYSVIITSDSGCVMNYAATSLVFPLPIANFSIEVACMNQEASFADQSSVSNEFSSNTINQWEWNFPPSTLSNEQNPNYTFQSFGNISVGLEVISNHGCIADTVLPVYVEPIPSVVFNSIAISGCSPVCVELVAEPEPNSDLSISNYVWELSNGTVLNSNQPTFNDCFYTDDAPEIIDVSLTIESTNGCSNSLSANGLITLYPNAIANFSISPQNPTVLDNSITTNNFSSHSTSWQWFTSFNGTSSIQHPLFEVPDISNNNQIILIANNQFDCPDTFTLIFEVKDVELIYVPNTFTPDGEQSNSVFIPVFSSNAMIRNYHFLVFNRWGEVVFETHDAQEGWNGIYNGNISQDGTYTWKIVYSTTTNSENSTLVGHVNLLR